MIHEIYIFFQLTQKCLNMMAKKFNLNVYHCNFSCCDLETSY